jgi:hypothetical protein
MNRLLKYILTLLIFCCTTLAMAQPGEPGDPDEPVPITGIEILLAAGGLLGAKKIYDNKKNSNK